MLMKMARLAPSLSCNSCGTTLGENTQMAVLHDDGSSFDHMVATSLKLTSSEVSRVLVSVAPAVSMPCGLPAPLPCKKAYSSNQAIDLANSVIRNFSRPMMLSCSSTLRADAVAGQLPRFQLELLELRLRLLARLRLGGPVHLQAAEERRDAGALGRGNVEIRDLQTRSGHRNDEGARADERHLGHDGHQLLEQLRRHGVAAGDAGRLGQGRLRLPGDEAGTVVLFEVAAVIASTGQQPVAERFARIAVAAGAEDGRHRVLAGQPLGLAELFQRFVDDGVQAAREAGQGALHRLRHQRRDRIVADHLGDAAGDELPGFRLGDVDAFPGLAYRGNLSAIRQTWGCSRRSTDGVKGHEVIRPSQVGPAERLEELSK